MDAEQEPVKPTLSSPVQTQILNKAWRSGKKVSVPALEKTPEQLASRFQGDGVRYKAKLIGIDEVPEAQGDKMCVDSMMKLKGWEAAGRRHGHHKQRVWLKVSSAGLRIVDERTGVVEHEHEIEKISSVKKDDSDPRAFSYIFGHNGAFKLFFIKMANAADPVIEDIRDVCQIMAQVELVPETTLTQNGTSLLLDEQVVTPEKSLCHDDLTVLFTPCAGTQAPSSPSTPSYHFTSPPETSWHKEMQDNMSFTPSAGTQSPTSPSTPSYHFSSPPGCPPQNPWASPQTPLAFPGQTLGAAPFSVPSATAWSQQGNLGAPYPGFNSPWTTQQAGSSWGQPNLGPPVGPRPQSPGAVTLPGAAWGQGLSAYPPAAAVTLGPAGGERFPDLHLGTTTRTQQN